MSIIGPLFSPHLIEEGATDVLQTWLPTYAAEVKVQYGLELPAIKSWGITPGSYDRFPEQALPALVVVAEGIGKGGEPEEYAGGHYRASWALGVAIVVQHPDMNRARKVAQIYGAAVRGALVQRRSLGAGGRVSKWIDEANPYKATEKRTRAAAENVFLVTQDEVVNWRQGPKGDEPPEETPGAYPEITEVDVDVEVKE